MTFEVGVVAHFTARHHLVGNFGPASTEHGHDYRVEVVVRGARLQQDGTLFDISILQSALSATLGDLEGRDLNTLTELARPNPSAEVVARFIHERVANSVTGLEELTVRVWESDAAFAAYATALK